MIEFGEGMSKFYISTRLVFWLLLGALAVVIFPYVAFVFVVGSKISVSAEDWSYFGSFYGGLAGTLLSGLAFAVLLANLIRQEQQIKELASEQRRLRVESTVGGLLDVLASIVGGMEFRAGNEIYKGVAVFKYLYRNFGRSLKDVVEKGEDVDSISTVESAYAEFYRNRGSYVGHYFRTMYTIVKTIESEGLKLEDKKKLYSWLTCRLSRFELLLLFYNCLSALGRDRFKPLIEESHLLEHIEDRFVYSYNHMNMYNGSAFVDASRSTKRGETETLKQTKGSGSFNPGFWML